MALSGGIVVRNFKERFCETYGCKPEEYERKVLFMSFYGHAKLICRLFWLVDRKFFSRDLELIRVLAGTLAREELKHAISDYRFEHPETGILRGVLKLRVSGRKLVELSSELLPMKVITLARQQPESQNPAAGS